MEDKLQTAITHLKYGIEECKDNEEDLRVSSWNYEEGVLLSANEAIIILEFIEKYQNEKNKTK